MPKLLAHFVPLAEELLFPRRCPVCDRILPFRQGLAGPGCCTACRGVLKIIREPRCLTCGKHLPDDRETCSDCRRRRFRFRRNVALWEYDDAARASVARYKYHGRQEYTGWYIDELMRIRGQELRRLCCEAVVPVPVHRSRYAARGFNQAGLLAQELAGRLSLPFRPDLLLRIRKTVPQKSLSPEARARNLRDALAVRKGAPLPASVLLVDDIFTTGSTLEASARALTEAGVRDVFCVTLFIVPDR